MTSQQLTMLTGSSSRTGNRRADRVLDQLESAWTGFQHAFEGLDDDALLIPGVTGAWSVRDLIAHVTWWDEEAITHLPVILAGGTPPRYSRTYGGIDSFNAIMTERTALRSLDEVRAAFHETHARLERYLKGLPPDAWVVNPRFRRRLKLDTFGHYPIHTAEIIAWREREVR